PLPDQEWTFVEVWTRNTIYALDSRLVCIAVIDQQSRRSHLDHALLGARLVGGQQRDSESMELSHPFPRPGSEAVFEQSKGRQVRFSQTSTVTRVVLRLRVLTVARDNLLPTWEEITGHASPAQTKRENDRASAFSSRSRRGCSSLCCSHRRRPGNAGSRGSSSRSPPRASSPPAGTPARSIARGARCSSRGWCSRRAATSSSSRRISARSSPG